MQKIHFHWGKMIKPDEDYTSTMNNKKLVDIQIWGQFMQQLLQVEDYLVWEIFVGKWIFLPQFTLIHMLNISRLYLSLQCRMRRAAQDIVGNNLSTTDIHNSLLGATFLMSIDNGCVLDYSIKYKTFKSGWVPHYYYLMEKVYVEQDG